MPIITLTTDFGLSDSYVGAMKGVILGIAPGAQIVDISHQVPPQDVRSAAYVLQGAVPFFPSATVHVVVVDPGVGSQRRPIAVWAGRTCYVGPDNGVFSFLFSRVDGLETWERGVEHTGELSTVHHPPAVVHLDNPAYWLPRVSRTFHGRDIFAPVAAHLAAGVPFERVGTSMDDPALLRPLQAERLADGHCQGQIVYVDHFGNLISNLPANWLAGRRWDFQIAGHQVTGPSLTYADAAAGQLVALVGSSGRLEIAVRNGSAARQLGVRAGEPIEASLRARGR